MRRPGAPMTESAFRHGSGSDRPEVLVVDGFFARPAEVRRHALGLRFGPDSGNYPGEYAPAGLPTDEILARLERLLGPDLDRSSVQLAFCRVTRRGADLGPHQRTPHAGCDTARAAGRRTPEDSLASRGPPGRELG